MRLDGSCQCGGVHFHVQSHHPVPYQRCYCSICRKTQGGGGYAINLAADAATMVVKGRENITLYHARVANPHKRTYTSTAERAFCRVCGTGLWLFSPEWPELIHPFASAIDTDLPTPPSHTHLMLDFRANWVEVEAGPEDLQFPEYPEESIADWHTRQGMVK